MFCSNCGKENPSGSRFCSNCGKALEEGQPVQRPSAEPEWETAEIVCLTLKVGSHITFGWLGSLDTYQFVAKASGPNGIYNAEVTEPFRAKSTVGLIDEPDKKGEAVDAHTGLVNAMLKDGWVRMPLKQWNVWFSDTFRRRLK